MQGLLTVQCKQVLYNIITVRFSDFEMSHGVEDENYYVSRGGKIPIKWTAPEVHYYDCWKHKCTLQGQD